MIIPKYYSEYIDRRQEKSLAYKNNKIR